jgi:hypothetical protein
VWTAAVWSDSNSLLLRTRPGGVLDIGFRNTRPTFIVMTEQLVGNFVPCLGLMTLDG